MSQTAAQSAVAELPPPSGRERSDHPGQPSGSRRIAFNFASLSAAAVAERLILLVSSIYCLRVLGPDSIGQVGWTAAVMSYFTLFVSPGLETIAKRQVARKPEEAAAYASVLFSIQILLAAAAFGIILLMSRTGLRGPQVSLLLICQGVALLLSPFNLGWLLYAHERMVVLSFTNLLLQLLQLPALFLLIHEPSHAARFVLLPYPFRIAALIFTAWYVTRHRLIQWRQVRWSLQQAWMLVREALPVGLSMGTILIYYNADAIILGFTHGDRVVGLYGTAYKLMLLPLFLSQAMTTAFFPALSRSTGDELRMKSLSGRFLRSLAWIGFSASAITFAVGRRIIELLYGPQYAEIGPVYEWLSLNTALVFVNIGLVHPLLTWGRQGLQFRITLVAATANLLFNLLLIPYLGVVGATATTLMAESIVLCLGLMARRRIAPIRLIHEALPPLAGAVAVAIMVRSAASIWPAFWWIAAGVGMVALAANICWCERDKAAALTQKLRSIGLFPRLRPVPGPEEAA